MTGTRVALYGGRVPGVCDERCTAPPTARMQACQECGLQWCWYHVGTRISMSDWVAHDGITLDEVVLCGYKCLAKWAAKKVNGEAHP